MTVTYRYSERTEGCTRRHLERGDQEPQNSSAAPGLGIYLYVFAFSDKEKQQQF